MKILLALLLFFSFNGFAQSVDAQLLSVNEKIEELIKIKDKKLIELNKCARSVKGFKVAGITTLTATGALAGVNVYQGVEQIKTQNAINDEKSRLEALKQDEIKIIIVPGETTDSLVKDKNKTEEELRERIKNMTPEERQKYIDSQYWQNTSEKDMYEAGVAYLEKGQNQTAIERFNKALEMNPNNPFSYYGRGAAEYHIGKLNEAKADIEKSLELWVLDVKLPFHDLNVICFKCSAKYDEVKKVCYRTASDGKRADLTDLNKCK